MDKEDAVNVVYLELSLAVYDRSMPSEFTLHNSQYQAGPIAQRHRVGALEGQLPFFNSCSWVLQ